MHCMSNFVIFLTLRVATLVTQFGECNSKTFTFSSPATGGASKVVPTMSPSRRPGMAIPSSVGNIPALSPIQGSPNKTCSGLDPQIPQGAEGGVPHMPDRALTVPENLSSFHNDEKSRDLQLVSGRNVVLNYGGFDRSANY